MRGAPPRLKMTDARIRRPWLSAFALYSVIAIANSALGFYVIDWLHVDARHAAVVVGYALGCAGLGLIVMQSAVARLLRIAPLQWLRWGALASAAVDAREQGACAGTMSAAQGLSMIVAPLAGTALYDWRPQAPFALIGVLLLLVACATWRSARRAAATQ
ncbi:putative membrane protein [Burkholderia humptydooensis]|nr:putative membrane protein [Burkholderia sp. 2002721687]